MPPSWVAQLLWWGQPRPGRYQECLCALNSIGRRRFKLQNHFRTYREERQKGSANLTDRSKPKPGTGQRPSGIGQRRGAEEERSANVRPDSVQIIMGWQKHAPPNVLVSAVP